MKHVFFGIFVYYDVVFPGKNPGVHVRVIINATKLLLTFQADSVYLSTENYDIYFADLRFQPTIIHRRF